MAHSAIWSLLQPEVSKRRTSERSQARLPLDSKASLTALNHWAARPTSCQTGGNGARKVPATLTTT
eukprot:5181822-Pleurochrysis_carterae.AAC.1